MTKLPRLKKGDEVRVIAPARSLSIIDGDRVKRAIAVLEKLGLKVSFGSHVNEIDIFDSSSIESRIADLHEAYRDPHVKMILTVIGGFNSNQLLRYLDYELIKNNPKILCGYSDITALSNVIFAKTGIVTYSGPHFSTFGEVEGIEYIIEYFEKCMFSDDEIKVTPSEKWYNKGHSRENEGYWCINAGSANGTIIGGNLCTLNLLQGTEYMPEIRDSVLMIEDDYATKACDFDRNLQSLIHLPEFEGVRGMIIGRFETVSKIDREKLTKIIKSKKELDTLPVLANVDFGHTRPMITFPIGGEVRFEVRSDAVISIDMVRH